MPQEDDPQPAKSRDIVYGPERWSDRIPQEVQDDIGNAIRQQVSNLPVNLFIEWFEPKFLERRWFLEAAEYIYIPHPEHWRDIDDA